MIGAMLAVARPPARSAALVLTLLGTLRPAAAAQERARTQGDEGAGISVYLVTMGPGTRVWERFGHNALWVIDPARGLDRVYNYGIFSFEEPGFLIRFVRGHLRYAMHGFDAEPHFSEYVAANRSIWVQELNLTPDQRVELRDFLLWNDRPENRFYAYDYYLDNCSTRIRDALDRVLGGQLRSQTAPRPTGTTFRFHTQRVVTQDLPVYTGLLLALGQPIDRPISVWEEMFLPLKVRERVREVTVRDAAGREVPLVRSEQTYFASTEPPPPDRPPAWTAWYLLAGLLLGGGIAVLAWRGTGRRAPEVAATSLAAAWMLIAGTAGVVLAGLWAFTDHHAAYWNENLLQFSPLAVPLAVLLLVPGWRVRWPARPVRALALAVATLSALGFVLQILPWLDQANGELIALALPPNVAVAWLTWPRNRKGEV